MSNEKIRVTMNARYKKNGHGERCRSMDSYLRDPKTTPKETLWYIGAMDDSVLPETLFQIGSKEIEWRKKVFPNVETLDYTLHVDEMGAPSHYIESCLERGPNINTVPKDPSRTGLSLAPVKSAKLKHLKLIMKKAPN